MYANAKAWPHRAFVPRARRSRTPLTTLLLVGLALIKKKSWLWLVKWEHFVRRRLIDRTTTAPPHEYTVAIPSLLHYA